MTRLVGFIMSAAVFAGLLLQAGAAHAQATRTWVSGVGDDVNPCSRTAPCKTFAGAISKTAAGGIINCLDPGGFGAVTITKSITIDCSGTNAGILASFTNGINVNAAAGDTITLRGLSIEGVGTGLVGVNFIAGATLRIENCRIFGFRSGNAMGVRFVPTTTARLFVSDTSIDDNGAGAAGGGIVIVPSGSGIAKATLRRVSATNNSAGLVSDGQAAGGFTHVQVVDSLFSANAGAGVTAKGTGSSVFLDRVASVHNGGAGVLVDGASSQVLMTNSTLSDNGLGLSLINGGRGFTYVTNHINGNAGADGAFTDTLSQR